MSKRFRNWNRPEGLGFVPDMFVSAACLDLTGPDENQWSPPDVRSRTTVPDRTLISDSNTVWLTKRTLEHAKDVSLGVTSIATPRDDLIRLGSIIQLAIKPFTEIAKNRLFFAEARSKAKALLSYEENWDDCGASSFSVDIVDRTISVLEMITEAADRLGHALPQSFVNPAGEGSIDISWSDSEKSLLVNVPHSGEDPVSYFGESSSDGFTAGEMPSDAKRPDLAMWLAQ